MANYEYAHAFIENEKEANRYVVRCMRILAAIVAFIWLLNVIGLFKVPIAIMHIAAAGGVVSFLLPGLILRFCSRNSPRLKIYIMSCCIAGLFMLSTAIPKHAILAWAAPIILTSHYYSKRLTTGTLLACIVTMWLSQFIGAFVGEWDPYFIGAFPSIGQEAIQYRLPYLTLNKLYKDFLFYALPRAMILVGLTVIISTLAGRTRRLLKKQVKDSVAKQQIESELNVATHIQTSMLPSVFPQRNEVDVAASMIPAKEVGGDFYDFFMVDERHIAIVMADVSGKGVPAALFMVIGKTLVKDHTQPDSDLGDVFSEVNELLCESNSEGLFITAFEGVLDLVTGEFNFVNAGHEMPFISRKGCAFEPHKIRAGFVLAGMEGMRYRAGSLTLEPGDKLFQYTDGVTEATSAAQELYGMERLQKVLGENADRSPAEILPAVKADIDAFVGDAPQFDDITMLCLEYKARMQP